MAIVTKVLGTVGDAQVPPHQAELSIDYDNALLRLTLVRIVNDTNQVAQVTGTATADPTRTFTMQCPAGQTATQNIPTGQANRLNITIDARGRVDGVEYHFLLV